MGDWNRAFRNDYTEPKPLREDETQSVLECTISPTAGRKTWNDVYLKERFLGMVRTKFCGTQEYKIKPKDAPRYCGETGNHLDPLHAKAIIALRNAIKI